TGRWCIPLDLRLPPWSWPSRTTQGDTLLVVALDQQCGADIRRIDEMLAWREGFLHQCLLDRYRTLGLMDSGCSRMHMRQQMRGGGLTGLTDMYHIASPLGVPLMAIARIGIIGRFDPFSRWRQ